MRPVERPLLGAAEQARPAGPLLLATLGDYCSICERPLPSEAWVLDRRTGEMAPWHAGTAGWQELLLVCHNCRDAHVAAGSGEMGQLLFPDGAELSFRVRGDSPLTYALEPVRIVVVGEDGTERASDEERVLVRGNTDAARATISHFALNTAYHDPETNTLRIPEADLQSAIDRRVDQRTNAWRTVTGIAGSVAGAPEQVREALLDQLRMIVSGLGFWSTCASALRATLGPGAPLARVLLPPERPPVTGFDRAESFPAGDLSALSALPAAGADGPRPELPMNADFDVNPDLGVLPDTAPGGPELAGPGVHNQFPGTRADALG